MRLAALGLATALMLLPTAIGADELATQGNGLLTVQLTDAITTNSIIQAGGYERDPLAKPFTHNLAVGIVSAAVLNGLVRIVFKHSPNVLHWLTVADTAAVYNNIGVLRGWNR